MAENKGEVNSRVKKKYSSRDVSGSRLERGMEETGLTTRMNHWLCIEFETFVIAAGRHCFVYIVSVQAKELHIKNTTYVISSPTPRNL